MPTGADRFTPSLATTSWQDSNVSLEEAACFRIQLVNRYGAARPAETKALTRFAVPPAAPVIGPATYVAADHHFLAPATYPAGTHLVYLTDENDASVCPGTYTSGGRAVVEDPDRPGVVQFSAELPDACVSFHAVDDVTRKVSEPTSIVAEAPPLPTETLNVTSLGRDYGYPWWRAKVDDEAVAQGNKVGYVPLPGACPDTLPTVTQWYTLRYGDSWSGAPADERDDLFFPSLAAGVNCLVVTSLDWFGWTGSERAQPRMTDRHGPVVMREFVDDGPLPPTVGQPTWNAAAGKFQVPVSDRMMRLRAIYDPDDPTTCPAPGASGAQLVPFVALSDDLINLSPPATPQSCVTFYVDAMMDGPVRLSQGVPVDLLVPQG
jgi:hypothetical protein